MPKKKERPYIGVTGFRELRELIDASKIVKESLLPKNYLAMFGLLVSRKRLDNPDAAGRRSPPAIELPFLSECASRGKIFPMMHYHTEDKETLYGQVASLFSLRDMYRKNYCRALQLNMDWPPLRQLERVMGEFNEMRITLQLPERAMKNLGIRGIARRASEYDGLVSWVLIDPSGGLGIDLDLKYGIELMNALRESVPSATIGIAGGFCGQNVRGRIARIRKNYPDEFCIDAEGRLMENDSIDMEKVRHYVRNASSALNS